MNNVTKFVHITDTHFRARNPIGRVDNFIESLFKKLDWVIQFCKEHHVENLIHTGDLFDSPNVENWVATTVAKKLSDSGLQVYYILGNHDLIGKNEDSSLQSKIGFFEYYPWFHLVANKPAVVGNALLMGVNNSKDSECPREIIFDIDKKHKDKFIICMLHSMIVDAKTTVIHDMYKMINFTECNIPDVDLVLLGHYHPGFKPADNPLGAMYSNPGAMARLNSHEAMQSVGPGLNYIKVFSKTKFTIKHIKIPCAKDVFNVGHKLEADSDPMRRAKFIDALNELKAQDINRSNIERILDDIKRKRPLKIRDYLTDEVLDLCKKTLKQVSDE